MYRLGKDPADSLDSSNESLLFRDIAINKERCGFLGLFIQQET
jgi:hypothetical protein